MSKQLQWHVPYDNNQLPHLIGINNISSYMQTNISIAWLDKFRMVHFFEQYPKVVWLAAKLEKLCEVKTRDYLA